MFIIYSIDSERGVLLSVEEAMINLVKQIIKLVTKEGAFVASKTLYTLAPPSNSHFFPN